MNIKQIRKATATKKNAAEARNVELHLKGITEGLTADETAEQKNLEETISNLDSILDELTVTKAPELDANLRALVAANID